MTSKSEHSCYAFDDLLRQLTFDFFGSGQHKITVDQLLSESDWVLLDVRSTEEAQTLSLPLSYDVSTVHIPTQDIPDRLSEIPRDKDIAVFCSAGTRSAIVYAYLRIVGFDRVRVLVGNYADIVEQAKPGKLWKRMRAKETAS